MASFKYLGSRQICNWPSLFSLMTKLFNHSVAPLVCQLCLVFPFGLILSLILVLWLKLLYVVSVSLAETWGLVQYGIQNFELTYPIKTFRIHTL